MNWLEVLQYLAPSVALYVGIRVDMAAMKVRLDHLERDMYQRKNP